MRAIAITPILFTIIIFGACTKEKEEELPPETQVGADTFGCLINGIVFKPYIHPSQSWPKISCSYRYIDIPNKKGFFFELVGARSLGINMPLEAIRVETYSLEIEEGKVYELATPENEGEAFGMYIKENFSGNFYFLTDGNLHRGELLIKRLDVEQGIISGTFWFDAGYRGDKVEVREGRFDMKAKIEIPF
jgi:hypothetical protein